MIFETRYTIRYKNVSYLCTTMSRIAYAQLYSPEITIGNPSLVRTCLVLVEGRAKFEKFIDSNDMQSWYLALAVDPSICWHRDIIESQLILNV